MIKKPPTIISCHNSSSKPRAPMASISNPAFLPNQILTPFEQLIEKANLYLNSIKIEQGDPENSEILYFQSKRSIVFKELNEIKSAQKSPSLTNSPMQAPNSASAKSGTNQSNSELFKNRPGMKSLTIIKSPLGFSSPQLLKKTSKKRPSIEDFSIMQSDSLADLELSEEWETTQYSANFDDSKKNKSLKKVSMFSTWFNKETLEELENVETNQKKEEIGVGNHND